MNELKTKEQWIERLDFGLFNRIGKQGADPLLWGETLSVIKSIQENAVKYGLSLAAQQLESASSDELNIHTKDTDACADFLKDIAANYKLP